MSAKKRTISVPTDKSAVKKASKKPSRKPIAKSTIRGKGWKRSIKIDEAKFEVISKAILASLSSTPMKFYDLVKKVEVKVKNFPGSVAWYAVSTLRELETQGKVLRTVGKPTTYRKK